MGIFGQNKKEAWQAFAGSMGAEFIDQGGFKGVKVRLEYKFWEIVMDTYTVSTGKSSTTYTRIRAIYAADNDFDFKLFRRTIFTKLAKALGRSYAETGIVDFDEAVAIRSIDQNTVKEIFKNDRLREMLLSIKRLYFYTKKTRGRKETRDVTGEKEIYYQTVGIIKDSELLTLIFGAVITFLYEFEKLNIAKSEKPKISYIY